MCTYHYRENEGLRRAIVEGNHDEVKRLVNSGAHVDQQDLKVAIEEGTE